MHVPPSNRFLAIRYLEKDDKNTAMVAGDYDLVFSETWGAPYDPHRYVPGTFLCHGASSLPTTKSMASHSVTQSHAV